ncbi:MAG TPA: guanylate kinase [Gaiellaceae bacterium]|nr:guanylate kinase [Gaiellaceae bacterium]
MPTRPVFVVTGPSGAGKGTLIKGLLERVEGLQVAVSATTRPQRPGEVDGRDYWFLSDDEFSRRVDAGDFLEWVPYVSGRRYGTLRTEIDRIAEDGCVCVLELELEGALEVQEEVPRSVTIFIAAPVEELERRLRERATESTGEIGDRITLAREQLERAHEFRYMVRNDDVDRATTILTAIVEAEIARAATMAGP